MASLCSSSQPPWALRPHMHKKRKNIQEHIGQGNGYYLEALQEVETSRAGSLWRRRQNVVVQPLQRIAAIREKKCLQMAVLRTAKKQAKRRWDPPKKNRENCKEISRERLGKGAGSGKPGGFAGRVERAMPRPGSRSAGLADDPMCREDEELGSVDSDSANQVNTYGRQSQSSYSLTLRDMADATESRPQRQLTPEPDELIASQVLTTMYSGLRQAVPETMEDKQGTTNAWDFGQVLTALFRSTVADEDKAGHTAQAQSPQPPSSPSSPSSTEGTPAGHVPMQCRGWVSPGEWDTPGSPLPRSAYDRMQWPHLFGPLFGPSSEGDVRINNKVSMRGNNERAQGLDIPPVNGENDWGNVLKLKGCRTHDF
ncbi:hypothetical protein B0H10DRAFT_2195711 [Mycena sp. CBHHK59/15]|nr:hypothetical protein B0H10DRAFT_2195711 [Mycena sp. CBHHK59/15]